MTTMTLQQQTAVTTRGASVVLSSVAGCGKTAVLTERYLSYLDRERAGVHQLIAFTFTDRAARLMRGRIRAAVERRVEATEGDIRKWWVEQLRGLETAAVCTIHSFCTSLLRQHALAAGLDPRFEVLEEVLAPNLREDAIRDTLLALLTDESADGEALRDLVRWYGWSACRAAIGDLLAGHDWAAWAGWRGHEVPDIVAAWADAWRQDVWPAYIGHRSRVGSPFAIGLEVLRSASLNDPKLAGRAAVIVSELPKLATAAEPTTAVEALIEAARVQGAGKAAKADALTYQRVKETMENLRAALKQVHGAIPDRDGLNDSARVGRQFLGVAAACNCEYTAEKRRRGYLDFQDLLVSARDLLRDRADVRSACRRKYQFVLVDELQDTDPVQMELVELLCGRELTTGKLFAVGDSKQSIYRFRGAAVELFERIRDRIPEAGRQSLSVNFRSQPGILHFTNALLREHMPGYEPLAAHVPAVNPGPCVEFLWAQATGRAADNRHAEAARLAWRLAEMIGEREMLATERTNNRAPGLRPVRPGDVVILFRGMTNVATYETALREAGLDYYLVGGRAFYAQQEVYDLLNLLKALENPHDALSLAGTLRSPFGCVSDDGLVGLCGHPQGPWAGLHDPATRDALPRSDRSAAARVCGWLDAWRDLKDRLPVARLLHRVLADSGYDAALTYEFLGERKLANLWKLIDQARVFDAAESFTLDDFVRRLEHLVDSQIREELAATVPENADVVRLMSIHQAKGLEFPVVVLADFNAHSGGRQTPIALFDTKLGCVVRPPADEDEPPFADSQRLWKMREEVADWHEDLRTLYVACTRAMDYLIVSASLADPPKPSNTAMTVLAERFDLVNGQCRDVSLTTEERPIVTVRRGGEGEVQRLGVRNARCGRPVTEADAAAIRPVSPH